MLLPSCTSNTPSRPSLSPGVVMPVVLMYLPMHVSCAAVAVLFATVPTAMAGGALAAFLVPYFAFTLGGHPAHTGGLGSQAPAPEWLQLYPVSAVVAEPAV